MNELDQRGYSCCPNCGRSFPFDELECKFCRLPIAPGGAGDRVKLWRVSPSVHGRVWTPPGWYGKAA